MENPRGKEFFHGASSTPPLAARSTRFEYLADILQDSFPNIKRDRHSFRYPVFVVRAVKGARHSLATQLARGLCRPMMNVAHSLQII